MSQQKKEESSVIKRRKALTKEKNERLQRLLEEAIIRYQDATRANDNIRMSDLYGEICRLYQPMSYAASWFRKYGHLYDTKEDFQQDYLRIFCNTLNAWLPPQDRKTPRYGGKGYFQNFFWGSLSHHYTNLVKSENSGKRNITTKCPICHEWCNPLSSHLREKHEELLWEQLSVYGRPVEELTDCPFCKSYKTPKQIPCEHQTNGTCRSCQKAAVTESIKRHLLSKHSGYLFERFHELFPSHITLSSKPVSAHMVDDEGEETTVYESRASDNRLDALLACNLNEVQQKIIERILNGASTVRYDHSLYKCSQEEFQRAFEELKTTMTLCGFEG